MGTFNRFEDIIAWQKARVLCKLINGYTLKGLFAKDFKLIGQIKGSSMDNIAEGFERGGNKEFIQFLAISKGSVGETRSQLFRALDNEYISKQEFQEAYNLADEVGKLTGALMKHLKSSELKGSKYK
ncbi:MAG: four helix bundle protein [Prolixibacteraceae bacterium]|jgi:four helix bundle protein|nr:four helix bundle protein [Prolixibacteraceae bacterium]MBT6006581.1 four helix bundle protein [Prolixibacteraceae bacterium]MBT6764791.1 four helix bundle protein [Prolixibacteraceae bacterium]MBT6997730.1 four helix bundle protein [Prolixibacteraceae bacterium]MBT7396498.1 four helix bundle protein [Prolixibacteraceae bacterium]